MRADFCYSQVGYLVSVIIEMPCAYGAVFVRRYAVIFNRRSNLFHPLAEYVRFYVLFCVAVFALVVMVFFVDGILAVEIVDNRLFKRNFSVAVGVLKEFSALLALTFVILDVSVLTVRARSCVVTYAQMSLGNNCAGGIPLHSANGVEKRRSAPYANVLVFYSVLCAGYSFACL